MIRNSIFTTVFLLLLLLALSVCDANAQSRNIGTPDAAPPTNRVCAPVPAINKDEAAQLVMTATKIRIDGTTIFFDAQLIPEVNKLGVPNGKYRPYWVSLIPMNKEDQFNRSVQIVRLNQTDLLFILQECDGHFVHYLAKNGIWKGEVTLD